MGACISNSEGKIEPPKKTNEPQVMANLIKLRVIQIVLDYHSVLFKDCRPLFFDQLEKLLSFFFLWT